MRFLCSRVRFSQRSGASRLLTAGFVLGGALGCSGGNEGRVAGDWPVDTAIVFGARRPRGDSLRVDVFVDATVSMSGYVAAPTSQYVEFLDNLEATIQSAWKRADVQFHRFGASETAVDRREFRAAKSAAFYTEKITGIDGVIRCDTTSGVSVVLTDLFQSEGDVNAIVAGIKDRCFARGRSVAVLGVKSAFQGTVYDARVPAYPYASTGDTSTYRPFYALLFGDAANLEWLLAQLDGGRGGRDYVVIAPNIVQTYAVKVSKAPNTKELSPQGATGDYRSAFLLLDGHTTATLLADVVVTSTPGAPPVRPDRLALTAYRRAAGRTDSAETHDVTLKSATRAGDTLRLTLGLALADPPGTYVYKLVLRTGGVAGFGLPPWVDQYSSPNPTPTVDANRTLNLAKFVSDLRRASSSIAQPAVAVWYVTVRKK